MGLCLSPTRVFPYDHQDKEGAEPESRSFIDVLRKVNARMVLGVLAAVALIVFIAQNTDEGTGQLPGMGLGSASFSCCC